MFDKSFHSQRFTDTDDQEDNDNVSLEENEENEREDISPPSPGMENLLKEINEVNRRLPKNVKFNRAFDVSKLCAEYLKNCTNEVFDLYLNCYKSFSDFLRNGMPDKVCSFLLNPEKYDLNPKKKDASIQKGSETLSDSQHEEEVYEHQDVISDAELRFLRDLAILDRRKNCTFGRKKCKNMTKIFIFR